ncbi:MAG: phosphoglucomutase/phosphomannomutase family protein, partial [Thermoanaerobaculia bacterium]|nr:phosphoglucomutase/phosphomannomutase family protein [Thermoanaerobaculia bacterium]
QAVSFTAWKRKLLGGVVITASHNPASYNGLKFKGWYGGSALPETYDLIAKSLGETLERPGGSVERQDFLTDYCAAVGAFLDRGLVAGAGLRILHDPIHGVAAGLPARMLGDGSKTTVTTIRSETNPSFGGVNPEPIPENIEASAAMMKAGGFDLAICNDGDADRVGILDERGEFVSPHKLISLLALELVRTRKLEGELVKTFSTTRLIETIAKALGVKLHETPIGFKYVADLMLARKIVIGGEESGGIGFGAFLPERDGILSGLLAAECVASQQKPLSKIVESMEDEFGRLHYSRRDVKSPMDANRRLIDRAASGGLDGSFGLAVAGRESKDGVKLNFVDGSWILFRKSGTEPIIRIYCESPDAGRVEQMLDRALEELGT